MKYTEEDIYEGMLVKWAYVYKVTNIREGICILLGVSDGSIYKEKYKISLIVNSLNDGHAVVVSLHKELSYEIY